MTKEKLIDNLVWLFEECGIELQNLTQAEIKILCDTCKAIYDLPDTEWEELSGQIQEELPE
jgi:hypothetical protein